MKIYKVKVNGKVYEVELEAVEERQSSISYEKVEETKKDVVSEGSNSILAPIAGKVLRVNVKPGDMVSKGQAVAVIEAMKLENEIQSAFAGKVKEVVVKEGDDVRNKDVMIVLE